MSHHTRSAEAAAAPHATTVDWTAAEEPPIPPATGLPGSLRESASAAPAGTASAAGCWPTSAASCRRLRRLPVAGHRPPPFCVQGSGLWPHAPGREPSAPLYKIVLDLGNALLYLHRDCEKCIVHGDIKPANVMLDVSYNAKLGDFGLARLVEHGQEPRTTQVIAGTPGYIDPEFIANRWPRAELDVYSFGVVLLEIACGKRPASRQPNGASSLLAWIIHLYDQGMILDAADQRLNGEFDQRQMERVLVTGLWCAHRDPIQRPSIEQAMDVLRSADAELPVLRAVHDEQHIRAMEEQAYGDLPVEDHPVHAVNTSTYFTSKDSAYLLAEE